MVQTPTGEVGISGNNTSRLVSMCRSHPRSFVGWQKASGFTLIEILVVVAMIALASGMLVIGVNTIFSRQLDSEAEKMNDWFESVAESAVFQSSVLGVRGDEQIFRVVAYYDNRWFQLNDIVPFELSGDMHWDVETEERIDFGQSQAERDQEREPFVAFLPSGQALPAGKLNIHISGQESLSLSWDNNADFLVDLGEESF